MPTELRYGLCDMPNKMLYGFCVEEPKEVLRALFSEYNVNHYCGISDPFGFFLKLDGLAIDKGVSPIGTTITGKLVEYFKWLRYFKLNTPMTEQLLRENLRDKIDLNLSDLLTAKKGKHRNYLELSIRERKNLGEELKESYEVKVATFKEIVEVTLDIQDPTEDDLRDILAGKNPKKESLLKNGKRVAFISSKSKQEILNRSSGVGLIQL